MKRVILPSKERWEMLCRRPAINRSELENIVNKIVSDVKNEGDKALLSYTRKYDKAQLTSLKVSPGEIASAADRVPQDLKNSIDIARKNIEKFHLSQMIREPEVETMPGVSCHRKSVPIEKVGLYIPGGNAPLFSTLLMLVIPARIAGCKEIILCTPPGPDGYVSPFILYTAGLFGITSLYKAGGAQAIAAMAYGTESIPRVHKIFGPGNQYVTKAKAMVLNDGIATDLPAGPSEILVIADKNASPEFIAADLLSQAEHGSDSQVILLTDTVEILNQVESELHKQLTVLPRRETASAALENSIFILLNSVDECIDFSNQYAPEHLILNTSDFNILSERIINAGSVFLGQYSCESAGDYASGTNHTLPTSGSAVAYSGVSTDSFVRKITFQEVTQKGLGIIGPAIMMMAEAEQLEAHKNAVYVRLKN